MLKARRSHSRCDSSSWDSGQSLHSPRQWREQLLSCISGSAWVWAGVEWTSWSCWWCWSDWRPHYCPPSQRSSWAGTAPCLACPWCGSSPPGSWKQTWTSWSSDAMARSSLHHPRHWSSNKLFLEEWYHLLALHLDHQKSCCHQTFKQITIITALQNIFRTYRASSLSLSGCFILMMMLIVTEVTIDQEMMRDWVLSPVPSESSLQEVRHVTVVAMVATYIIILLGGSRHYITSSKTKHLKSEDSAIANNFEQSLHITQSQNNIFKIWTWSTR